MITVNATEKSLIGYRQAVKYGKALSEIYRREKRQRHQLEFERTLTNTVFSSILDGLIVIDDRYVIQRASESFAESMMIPPDQIIDRPLTEILLVEGLRDLLDTLSTHTTWPLVQEMGVVLPVENESGLGTITLKRRSFLVSINPLDVGLNSVQWVMTFQDQTERNRLHDAVSRLVAPEIASHISQHDTHLGGELVTGSVLFADIRGFTSIAESMPSGEVITLLNQYFATIEPVISRRDGWIAKFGGDSLLALFGVLSPNDDHSLQAVHAACDMQAALTEFNEQQRPLNGTELRIGIGIASGEMIAGYVGGHERMEYTVIGDTVNLAARIEELTRKYHADILVSESVYPYINGHFVTTPLPITSIRGREQPAQLYTVTLK